MVTHAHPRPLPAPDLQARTLAGLGGGGVLSIPDSGRPSGQLPLARAVPSERNGEWNELCPGAGELVLGWRGASARCVRCQRGKARGPLAVQVGPLRARGGFTLTHVAGGH